ncbi:hypothetical protein TSUD_60810 [Trifolium subterraneum]|uniref:Reverse transcriptase domain-containing protein n=1 Tax=Trifolium subterraneum TaxID=3900 RepID=A0A2Z6NRG5_TRISU|nr:hypothetical protein TSUD_60810 [Trifolium subterraneum]
MKWVKEGDSNSRYFHESIKIRRRRNQLVALKDGDRWVQGVEEVKDFVKNFFENNVREKWENRPNLNRITFQTLSEEDNIFLLAPFFIDEVREVIWSSDGNKSPGPDSFNFNFLKVCWEIIKGDIMAYMLEFHKNAVLPKAITTSFLALIPKKDHPQVLSNYRPICLVSSLYKILSKVLAGRLKKVMGKLISEVQLAFLPNRQILDGVLITNELIDLAKRRKDKCLFFKVDFERAYYTVNWNFLDYMLSRMELAEGLRQGDPLSHFLFLIIAEGLAGLMRRAVDNGTFHGYKVSNDISFHTLQFANDTIIVGEVPLTETEMTAEAEIRLLLEQVQLCRDSEDKRRWIPNKVGIFTVQSAYVALQNKFNMASIEPNTLTALKRLWNNSVPSKVLISASPLGFDGLNIPTHDA